MVELEVRLLRLAKFAAVLTVTSVVFSLSACWPVFPLVPRIARNLDNSFEVAQKQFNQRIVEKFPVGMKEDILIKEFVASGFEYSHDDKALYFRKMWFPCGLYWRVHWKTDAQNKINEIVGRYGGSFL